MDQKQQIVDRLKQANNVLVTVSNNPSVDQLASCIGLTLALNKLGKHATAVFSGAVPSTIEFLQPEKTIETNTDSLRDFIISLDKTKADKLRYKVEDKVVKIFITPYRASIGESDLEFGQGDFNVELVIALGVHNQTEVDQAITAHGRILHDATVATVNIKPGGELGGLNWLDAKASSLSELVAELIGALDKKLFDAQISTAVLTGIVAETGRFSNAKTSPATMSVSADLMAAGANQQLVVAKLEEAAPPPPPPEPPATEPKKGGDASKDEPAPVQETPPADGTIEISHNDKPDEDNRPVASLEDLAGSDDEGEKKPPQTPKIQIDEQGALRNIEEKDAASKEDGSTDPTHHVGGSRMILQPPSMGGQMSASGSSDESFNDPLSLPPSGSPPQGPPGSGPASSFSSSPASATITPPATQFMPPSMTPGAPAPPPVAPSLPTPPLPPSSSGQAVSAAPQLFAFPGDALQKQAPPDTTPPTEHVDNARNAVAQAFSAMPLDPGRPGPIQALNAQPLGDPLHATLPPSAPPPDLNVPAPAETPGSGLNLPAPVGPPPPVPPPMMPQQ